MTAENTAARELFGIPIDLPGAWEDLSLYRFVAPASDDLGVELPTASKTVQFRDNLVVTRSPLPPGVDFAGFLEHSNAIAMQQDGGFKLLQAGKGSVGGVAALWQDTVQSAPGVGAPVYQRSIALPGPVGLVTLVVITARQQTLETMTQVLPFARSEAS